MAVRERPADRGRRLGRSGLHRVLEDFRLARIAAGLSHEEVGSAIGKSRSWVSRFERALLLDVAMSDLAPAVAVVGLDLRMSTSPGATAHRDHRHAALLERVRALLASSWMWATEVPLPNPGDPRSWDAMVRGSGVRLGIEAEVGPRDGQELKRRLALKRRDGAVDHVVLALSDTRANREFLAAYGSTLREDFPLGHRSLAKALRAGEDPCASGILVSDGHWWRPPCGRRNNRRRRSGV